MCWGYGALGNGTFVPTNSPPVPVSNLSGVVAIAAGATHTCALLPDGTVQCWGEDGEGDLGNGGADDVTDAGCSFPCALTPSPVPGLSGVTAISSGDYTTCVLLAGGAARCWRATTPAGYPVSAAPGM